MSERKNIDRLFQEKFKDFEANPAEEVWGDIASKLEEKKRKRVIPFWWKLSGVAALLLVGFLITESVLNEDMAVPKNSVVHEETPKPNNQSSGNAAESDKNKSGEKSKDNPVVTNDSSSENSGIQNNNSNNIIDKKIRVNHSKSSVAETKTARHRSLKNKLQAKESKDSLGKIHTEKGENPIANHNAKVGDFPEEQTIAQNNNKQKPVNADSNTNTKNLNLDALKGNKDDKAIVAETDKKVNDTASKTTVAQNALEELLNKKDGKPEKESKLNRWQLTSNVAPIFLGSTANGSPIDSTLVNNGKSYNTGIGFGLGVSYAVNKKLTVRTGMNKFNMSYNTNDIVYFADIESRGLKNVKASAEGAMIHIESSNIPAPAVSETTLLPFENSFVHKNKGYINQEMGYLEMPLEVTYALVDKRFGLKIIGGFSTLFLQDNEVSVVSGDRSTFLGEASNLNDVHFSTNIGLGLKYGFLKSFEFNVEPTFKYQINTFSNDAGNFKPYLFGIYSGISYKF